MARWLRSYPHQALSLEWLAQNSQEDVMSVPISKRSRRRNRWRKKLELRILDEIALKAIHKSYMFSACTWGGTRCPDCGVAVRPHWLADYSGELSTPKQAK